MKNEKTNRLIVYFLFIFLLVGVFLAVTYFADKDEINNDHERKSWSFYFVILASVLFFLINIFYLFLKKSISNRAYIFICMALIFTYMVRFLHCRIGVQDCPNDANGTKNSTQILLLLIIFSAIVNK